MFFPRSLATCPSNIRCVFNFHAKISLKTIFLDHALITTISFPCNFQNSWNRNDNFRKIFKIILIDESIILYIFYSLYFLIFYLSIYLSIYRSIYLEFLEITRVNWCELDLNPRSLNSAQTLWLLSYQAMSSVRTQSQVCTATTISLFIQCWNLILTIAFGLR